MKERLTILMIISLAVGVLTPAAHAGLAVYLDDPSTGTAAITVYDQGVGDLNPTVGAVTYSGSFDSWTINVTTGVSKPVIGGVTDPQLDLNSINASSLAGGTLLLMATDTGFSPSWGGQALLESQIGGTTTGSLTFNQVLDEGNTEFATSGVLSVALGPFGPGAFSATGFDAGLALTPFSLTEIVLITHTGGGITSFDAISHVTPVPGAILLGLLGLGAAGLKLRRFA